MLRGKNRITHGSLVRIVCHNEAFTNLLKTNNKPSQITPLNTTKPCLTASHGTHLMGNKCLADRVKKNLLKLTEAVPNSTQHWQ